VRGHYSSVTEKKTRQLARAYFPTRLRAIYWVAISIFKVWSDCEKGAEPTLLFSLPRCVDGDGNEDRWDYVGCFEKDYNLDFEDEDYTPGMTPTVRPPVCVARLGRASRLEEKTTTGRVADFGFWILVLYAPYRSLDMSLVWTSE